VKPEQIRWGHAGRWAWIGALLLLAAGGCLTTGPRRDAVQAYVTFHAFAEAPAGGRLVMPVKLTPSRTVYARRVPVLSSHHIRDIEAFPVEGGCGLRLLLSRRGCIAWQLASEYRGRQVLMLVDGHCRGLVTVNGTVTDGALLLSGPFSPAEAARISDHAAKNYVTCNKHGELEWNLRP
jgi:hypothetical protein